MSLHNYYPQQGSAITFYSRNKCEANLKNTEAQTEIWAILFSDLRHNYKQLILQKNRMEQR